MRPQIHVETTVVDLYVRLLGKGWADGHQHCESQRGVEEPFASQRLLDDPRATEQRDEGQHDLPPFDTAIT